MASSVSVIVVSYYTGPTLWLTIASALRQPECREIIIVNNGNMTGVEKRLRDLAAKDLRVRLLSGHGNVGFGKANNMGVAVATGDYVLLLNPDSLLFEGALAKMLEEMERWPENTMAGCYLINPDGSEQRGGRRALLTPTNAAAESFGLGFLLPSEQRLNHNRLPMPEATHEVPAISGAFMMLSRSFYQRLGGFDEAYFLHMEDMDFCYRVHKAGGKVICVPSVRVMHFRSTSEVTSAFIEKFKAKGFIRYLEKFFSENTSKALLLLLRAGIYARLWMKIIMGKIDSMFVPPLAGKQEIARIALLYRLAEFEGREENLAGKTLMVTGSHSQLGLCIIGKALAQGAQVIAVDKEAPLLFNHTHLQWLQSDLSKDDGRAQCAALKADVLFHAAPLELLADLLQELKESSVHRVIAFVDGLTKEERDSEALAALFRTARERMCDLTLLNPQVMYGVGLDRNITAIADIIRRYGNIPISGKGSGLRNPTYVLDVADAALKAAENPATYGRHYDIGGKESLGYRDMIMRIADYIGKPVRLVKVPYMPAIIGALGAIYQLPQLNAVMARRMNRDISFDNQAAIEDFGYYPSGFLEKDVTL
ncbi:MAG TPA: glycosyltransferase [Rickettsiales bacterium]|nr:glycosyltransferase [Rickettsiales bacterium]